MNEADLFLDRSRRAFNAAELLLSSGYPEFAASRVYYAIFYTATALCDRRDVHTRRHGRLISEYGRLFARTQELDPAYHWLLRAAFDLRQYADYGAQPVVAAGRLERFIADGQDFLAAARSYLAEHP